MELNGSLDVMLDDRTLYVTADGSRIRAEIGALARPRRSFRLLRSSFSLAKRLSRVLDAGMLTLVVTRDGRTIAELGSGVRGVPLGRLFGLSRVRLPRK